MKNKLHIREEKVEIQDEPIRNQIIEKLLKIIKTNLILYINTNIWKIV